MADTLIQWIQTSTTVLTLGHMHCLCIITLAFLMGLQHSTTTSPLATIKHEGHHIFKETIYMYYLYRKSLKTMSSTSCMKHNIVTNTTTVS